MLILFVPVGMSDTFAQSEPGEDSTDEIRPVGTVEESADIKLQEIEEKQQTLKNKHHAINEEFNSTNSTTKIKELKSDYIQTIKELNTLSYVEPERDYVAEWRIIDSHILELEEKQLKSFSEPRQIDIDDLYHEVDLLEQENIFSMKVEPELKKKAFDLERQYYDKYINDTSSSYVGKNSVNTMYFDFAQKQLVIVKALNI